MKKNGRTTKEFAKGKMKPLLLEVPLRKKKEKQRKLNQTKKQTQRK